MPSAPEFEAPQGTPFHSVQLRAISESLAGNGVVANGDLQVTATATDLEIQVAAGTYFYIATEYTLGAAETHTLSAGDGTNDRWDTVYFDTATQTSGVREGTPAQNPVAPDIQSDEALLAVIYVPSGATDVPDSDILNWRAKFSNEAEEVHYNDTPGVYPGNSVEDALDELQEAAQISAYPLSIATDTEATAYPLALADLASPFGLPNITDMDAAGNDLSDSSGPGVIYDASAGVVLQGVLGGPPSSLTSYPLPIGDLNSPFGLPNITDMDAAGNDLTDSTVGVTIWDTSNGYVPRAQIDDQLITTTVTSTTYTTSGEEVIFVDTSVIGGASTITIASADIADGNVIRVVDSTGAAASNSITIDTGGSETIDGSSSLTIDDDYGSAVLTGTPGGNLNVTGGTAAGVELAALMEGTETGNVPASDQGILIVDSLEPGETVRVQKAVFTTATVQAIPSGIDLELVTFDNSGSFTSQAILASGDGSTIYDSVTGDPIASYENTGTSAESIGVLVDNTTATGQEVVAKVSGDIV